MDIEKVVSQVTGAGTVGGGGFTIFSGLTENEVGILAGIALTIIFGCLNLAVTWCFKQKHYQIEKDKFELERRKLEKELNEVFRDRVKETAEGTVK